MRGVGFTPKDKAQCALWMARFNSAHKARSQFYRENGKKFAPNASSIKRWYNTLISTGFVDSQIKVGRPPVADDIVQNVSRIFNDNPQTTIREATQQLPIGKSTVQRIVRKKLKLYPYKIKLVHALREEDYARREEFARTMLDHVTIDRHFLESICFTDECTVHVSGLVHRHNVRIWAKEKPRVVREVERASPKVNVWCGLFIDRIIGPYFFDEETVNQTNFNRLLHDKVIPELEDRQPDVHFQLDGAPPHWGLRVRETLHTAFPGRWIGRDGPIPWPARSPDLTPLDFFLWGYMKTKVFKTPVRDVNDLKERIRAAIRSVRPQMLVNTWRELKERLERLQVNGGKHVEGGGHAEE